MPSKLINLFEITGGACRTVPGPCAQTTCRFNLTAEGRDNRGGKPAEEHVPVVRESCALEAAERGGMTLTEIATRFALTRERVRQIEYSALMKLRDLLRREDGDLVPRRRPVGPREPHPPSRSQ